MEQEILKHVTDRQGMQFAENAREFGLTWEEFSTFLNNKEKLESFLKSLQDNEWFENLKKSAEKIGARVHLIEGLVVDYTKSHNQAVLDGAPETFSNNNVLKVADQSVIRVQKTIETIILLNWENGGGSYEKALQWGLANGLRKTTTHTLFAIGESFPKLNYKLGQNPMYVVETTGCTSESSSNACHLWWIGAKRRALLDSRGCYGDTNTWFPFSVKKVS